MIPALDYLCNSFCHLLGWGQWIVAVRLNESLKTSSYTAAAIERCRRDSSIWWCFFLWRICPVPICRLLICRSIEPVFLSKIIIIFKGLYLNPSAVILCLLLSLVWVILCDMLMWEVNVWKGQIPLVHLPHNLLLLSAHEIWRDTATSIDVLEVLLQNFDCRLVNTVFFYFLWGNILRLDRCLGIYQLLIKELLL